MYGDVPRVMIIGAGIGGLCLAHGLKRAGIPFTVYERDPTPNYRTQGYCLQINPDGYEALESSLPPDLFELFLKAMSHFEPGFTFLDAKTGAFTSAPDDSSLRPKLRQIFPSNNATSRKHVYGVDRCMLRSLLLTDLEEGREIRYGMVFKKFALQPNGRVHVLFENGQTVEGSILVGADGANSRVRRQYIPNAAWLMDTDGRAIYGKTPITPQLDRCFPMRNTVMVTSKDPYMSLVMEPMCYNEENKKELEQHLEDTQDYFYWVLYSRSGTFHKYGKTSDEQLFALNRDEIAGLSRQLTHDWDPRIRLIFEKQLNDASSFIKVTSMDPDIDDWKSTPVTLMGDAIHTMTPAGIGCNTALQDVRLLVKCIREKGVTVDAVAAFEKDMRKYGRKGIAASAKAGKRIFDQPPFDQMDPISYYRSNQQSGANFGMMESENWYQGNNAMDDPNKLIRFFDFVLCDEIERNESSC